MTTVAELVARLTADTSGFKAGLSGAEQHTKSTLSRMSGAGKRFASTFLTGAGIGGGLFGAQQLGVAIGNSLRQAEEAIVIGRETARVIKTTGGAANVTTDHVEKLSDSLSRKSAIDDELIHNGANLMLTFTRVRNEVGQGNNVYDRAVRLSLDMSKALGTDLKSSAIQVGKALNDPLKGITALSRAGVSFTEEQKEQIRVLVEAGDMIGAQKIILGELAVEFEGAAEKAKTPAAEMRLAWANAQEEIGKVLMPALTGLVSWITETGIPTAMALGEAFGGAWDFASNRLLAFQHNMAWVMNKLGADIPYAGVAEFGPDFDNVVRNLTPEQRQAMQQRLEGRASGGSVMAGHSYVVGERGPEVLTMGGNGHVTPNGGGLTVVVQGSVLSDGDLIDVIRRYESRNGASWRNSWS